MKGKLPRWDLGSIYPSFDSQEFAADKGLLGASVAALQRALGRCERRGLDARALLDLIARFERAGDAAENLSAYAQSVWTADTGDRRALAETNVVDGLKLPLSACAVRFRALLAANRGAIASFVKGCAELRPYRFFLEESLERARFEMTGEMEGLAGDLARAGADAWARLHAALASSTLALWDEATGERTSIAALRGLAHSPDRALRARAYRAELSAWKSIETPCAAALNGVKGMAVCLDGRRGWGSAAQKSCFQSRIGVKTLRALIDALEGALPVFRRYLAAKARLLGVKKCAFYDLFAPLASGEARVWSWKEACGFIAERFEEFDPLMARFARMVFARSWIDAGGRLGKIGGAYCVDFPLARESRILVNFEGSFDSLLTVAHEVGHAWHHELVKDLPRFLAGYPMTLAETASIFAETITLEGALRYADEGDELALIEGSVKDSCQVIVDILSRFYFERELFERRERAELPPEELCAMMLDAQKKTYGGALDGKALHPYMWAVKDHYYDYALPFYNYPYAFGQLFSLALYARAKDEGAPFAAVYRALLRRSGSMSAAALARGAGFDIEDARFWQDGLAVIAERVKRFERMAALHARGEGAAGAR
ncbi:MAG: M3 family oligoendopeptidase [Spirochaetaceae bacterium]|jgi:pepF/M3 family oligoendopeptidase|nr:M3 family oligoendopeptidase [Spirochaetaceae bacterium]